MSGPDEERGHYDQHRQRVAGCGGRRRGARSRGRRVRLRWTRLASVRRCWPCSCARPGNPAGVTSATLRFWTSMARIGPVAAARWVGADAAPPVPAPDDKRFTDRTWADNPAFFALRQAYLAASQLSRRPARRWRGRHRGRREGGARRGLPAGRARADELPAHQSGGDQEGDGDRRHQSRGGRPQLRRRPAAQRRTARVRSTRAPSGSARISRPRRARSCSGTS